MGAWDTGIFDNDTAADFSSDVEHCSDVQARHDLLMATMGAFLEHHVTQQDMLPGYEFESILETALAAAAYVADAKNGRHQFTDNAYAMGRHEDRELDDDTAWYHIDLGTPGPELVQRAVETTKKALDAMRRYQVEQEWIQPAEELMEALREKA
jgi:hypothetical protein